MFGEKLWASFSAVDVNDVMHRPPRLRPLLGRSPRFLLTSKRWRRRSRIQILLLALLCLLSCICFTGVHLLHLVRIVLLEPQVPRFARNGRHQTTFTTPTAAKWLLAQLMFTLLKSPVGGSSFLRFSFRPARSILFCSHRCRFLNAK
uniref:(northern house mosquito) hypothetical protein n=3 Tax=Culex pipiens TaxID=7175 RepID=A0A8D8FZE6_CULPI